MAEFEDSSPEVNQRKRRERDGRVLLWIAAGFLLLSLAAAGIGNLLPRDDSFQTAMAFSAMSISAATVLGAWGIAHVWRHEATQATRATIAYLRRFRWRSSRRKMIIHFIVSVVAVVLSHVAIILAVDYSHRDDIERLKQSRALLYIADSSLLGVRFDVLLQDRNIGHVVCEPEQLWNPDKMNWYEHRFLKSLSDEAGSTLGRLGWSRTLFHAQVEGVRAEAARLNDATPLNRDTLIEIARKHSDWQIDERRAYVYIILPENVTIDHTFAEDAKLWIVDDADHLLVRRDLLNRTQQIIYRDKRSLRAVYIRRPPHNDDDFEPDRRFSSLPVCLGAQFFAWLAILTPFFYLRLERRIQTAG